ncbi:unnamed protein product, partial [Owenia fusiformis]
TVEYKGQSNCDLRTKEKMKRFKNFITKELKNELTHVEENVEEYVKEKVEGDTDTTEKTKAKEIFDLYMLDISVRISNDDLSTAKEFFDQLKADIGQWKADINKDEVGANGRVVQILKVTGEKKLIAVVETSTAKCLEEMIGLLPVEYDVTVSPLVPYDGISKSAPEVNDDLPTSSSQCDSSHDTSVLWLNISIETTDKSLDEVLESLFDGQKFEGYKEVGEQRVHLFVSEKHRALDGILFPMVTNGEKTTMTTKSALKLQ